MFLEFKHFAIESVEVGTSQDSTLGLLSFGVGSSVSSLTAFNIWDIIKLMLICFGNSISH